MKCLKLFTKLDYLSNEVKLTIHKGEARVKTFLGGLLSCLSVCITLALAIYFFVKFLEKKSIFISNSSEASPFLQIENSHNFPFLLRLTDNYNQPFKNAHKIYSINAKYWNIQSYNANENSCFTIDIPIEKCDLNKHFGEYRSLFTDITDVETFYCSALRSPNQTIEGRYGDIYPYGYYDFNLVLCMNSPDCYEKSILEEITESVYLDFRTVDFKINSQATQAKVDTAFSNKHLVSSTVYKRIWMYLSGIKYITDTGLFFSLESIETFSKFDSMRYDTDHREILKGLEPGVFATLTIANTGTNFTYNRHYLKMQEYLASIGGIVNFIQIAAMLLNYTFAQNSYYYKLIDNFTFNQTSQNKIVISSRKNSIHNQLSRRLQFNQVVQIVEAGTSLRNEINESKEHFDSQQKTVISDQKIMNRLRKWQFRMFPHICLNQREREIIQSLVDSVNSYMNIISILRNIEENQMAIKEIESNCRQIKTYSEQNFKSVNIRPNKNVIKGPYSVNEKGKYCSENISRSCNQLNIMKHFK